MLIFEISRANGCLYSRGAYFYGVLYFECKLAVVVTSHTDTCSPSLSSLQYCRFAQFAMKPQVYLGVVPGESGTYLCLYSLGAYFWWVLILENLCRRVIIGAYFQGVLILCGCRFYGIYGGCMLYLAHNTESMSLLLLYNKWWVYDNYMTSIFLESVVNVIASCHE